MLPPFGLRVHRHEVEDLLSLLVDVLLAHAQRGVKGIYEPIRRRARTVHVLRNQRARPCEPDNSVRVGADKRALRPAERQRQRLAQSFIVPLGSVELLGRGRESERG